MAATSNRDELLAEARHAWAAYEASGTDEDFAAARQATEAAKVAGIPLAEIGDHKGDQRKIKQYGGRK